MRVDTHAAITNIGRKRRRNEDALVVSPPLFAVADGMGGTRGGRIAAKLVADVLKGHTQSEKLESKSLLHALIKEANRQVFEYGQADPELTGMGTTVTAAIVENNCVVIAHVGDSRAYLLRGEILEQLTEDHSLVAELVKSGYLTPEEASLHPQRAVITRALGTDRNIEIDIFATDIQPGDQFLLCTDGLTTMVPNKKIAHTLLTSTNTTKSADELVQAANQAGGEDNISLVIFTITGET